MKTGPGRRRKSSLSGLRWPQKTSRHLGRASFSPPHSRRQIQSSGCSRLRDSRVREIEKARRPPPLFPRSRAHSFARLSRTRYPYYLTAWKRLDSELIGVSFTPFCEEVGWEGWGWRGMMLADIPEVLQGRRSAQKLIGLDNLISHLGWEWYHFLS